MRFKTLSNLFFMYRRLGITNGSKNLQTCKISYAIGNSPNHDLDYGIRIQLS